MPTRARTLRTQRVVPFERDSLVRQHESLRQVIESISAELELRPLLTRFIRHACKLIGAEIGIIGLVDPTRRIVRAEATYQMPTDELGAEFSPGEGVLGRVLLTHAPLLLPRYGDIARPTRTDLLDYAALAVPIFWRDHLIGVFSLGSPPPRRFSERDVEWLAELARHAAIAITNARLYAEEKNRTARFATLNRITRLITGTLSLEQILQIAVDSFNQELHYPRVELMLLDPDDPQTLVLQAMSGAYTRTLVPPYRQRVDEGILGAAVRQRQHLLVPDVRQEPRYIPIPGGEKIRSEIAVPILAGDELLGALNVESENFIGENEAADLDILADQLAVAIQNARRYEDEKKRNERLALIARVGQRLTARLEPDELFNTTVEELHGRLGYDHVSLFLLDPHDSTTLVQRARASRWSRGEAVGYRQSIHDGILGLAARQRAPVLVNDTLNDPNFIAVPNANELRAELAVPILSGEHLLGVLDLASANRFREQDVTALQIIADQLSVAISHAQLFQATQTALDETKLLYDISRRIGDALDVDDVITAYLDQVAAHGQYVCNIALFELNAQGERESFVVWGRWSPDEGLTRPRERVPYTRDALDPLLDAGQTVTFANIYTDPRAPRVLREIQKQSERPALVLIPLMVSGKRIGLVILSSPHVHEWSEPDLQPFQASAAQLATTIDNRRQQLLLRERTREIAVLQERQRLARELHDSVTQIIFSMTLIAQSLAPVWNRDPVEGEKRIQRLVELSQAALVEMRSLLKELRPPEVIASANVIADVERIQHEGLESALQHHLANLTRDGLTIELDARAYTRSSRAEEETLYRIAQEALNNVVKHSRAGRVDITLATENGTTRLLIHDDGVGLAGERSSGMGLETMRERAETDGGTFEIESTPGAGTTIRVSIPTTAPGSL